MIAGVFVVVAVLVELVPFHAASVSRHLRPRPSGSTIPPARVFFSPKGGKMKTIDCWQDLVPFGIDPLTGEACALSWRILFASGSGRPRSTPSVVAQNL